MRPDVMHDRGAARGADGRLHLFVAAEDNRTVRGLRKRSPLPGRNSGSSCSKPTTANTLKPKAVSFAPRAGRNALIELLSTRIGCGSISCWSARSPMKLCADTPQASGASSSVAWEASGNAAASNVAKRMKKTRFVFMISVEESSASRGPCGASSIHARAPLAVRVRVKTTLQHFSRRNRNFNGIYEIVLPL